MAVDNENMKAEDFITLLSEYYGEISNIKLDFIIMWLNERNIQGAILFKMFRDIVENFTPKKNKMVPDISEVKYAYQKYRTFSGIDDGSEAQRNKIEAMPVMDIVKMLTEIHKKEVKCMTMLEKSALNDWDDLYSEHGICVEAKVPNDMMMKHLHYVKDQLIQNKRPYSICDIKNVSKRPFKGPRMATVREELGDEKYFEPVWEDS